MHGQPAPPLDSAPHSDAWGEAAPPSRRRIDIQVLRGVAVLMVVAYHAMPRWVKDGFLGVDIFFVISGFLITGHILRDLERKRFGLGGFYMRRARRLLPAAWMTFFVTTLLAYPLLTSSQWRDYLAQLVGALTFTANFVLAHQSGYFEAAAAAKPLLHIWSLSLEEQFYFIAPIILLVLGRRLRGPALIIGAALSLALCVTLVSGWLPVITSKAAGKIAFYMLPARAWELLAGGLAAWLIQRRPTIMLPPAAKWTALMAIVAVCFHRFDYMPSRGDAVAIVIATAVLLLGQDGWIRRWPAQPVAIIGDWSYSIYLIHWPLLAFANAVWLGDPPTPVMLALAAASIPLGWAQYRWIEQPFQKRLATSPKRVTAWAAAAIGAFILACAPAAWASRSAGIAAQPPVGLGNACDQHDGAYRDLPRCRTSPAPKVAVWGDSYAMHLIPGLIAEREPLVQVTMSACMPAPGVAQLHDNYTLSWARDCTRFTESALEALERSTTVRTVVIGSMFSQVIDPAERLLIDGRPSRWRPVGAERLTIAIRRLQASGKRVIIVAPTPHPDFDAGQCSERRAEHLPILLYNDCVIDLSESKREQQHVVAALREVQRQTGVQIVWPEQALCKDGRCPIWEGGALLYRLGGHLTPVGSTMVIERLDLARLIAGGA